VYDKPILLINITDALGNCYLKLNELAKAKLNYEYALQLI